MDRNRYLIVKIGSAVLVDEEGAFSRERLQAMLSVVLTALERGLAPVLIASGAVASGGGGPLEESNRFTRAAVGQARVTAALGTLFLSRDLHIAQILLTRDDVCVRASHLSRLLADLTTARTIPVLNENDALAIDGNGFPDNDALAADVALLIRPELAVFFSEVDGIYERDPRSDPQARRLTHLETIDDLTPYSNVPHARGRGGIRSKLTAIQRLMSVDVPVYIGSLPCTLESILSGRAAGTYFGKRSLWKH